MEDNKHKVLLTVIGVGTLLIALAGATFAYFSATSVTTTQTVTTSSMDLTVAVDGSTTHITNIKPTTWSDDMDTNLENKDIAQVVFNVTSTSSAAGSYAITMNSPNLALNTGKDAAGNDLVGGTLDQVKYKVYKVTDGSYSPVADAAGIGTFAVPTEEKEIVTGTVSSDLQDQYVIFVYIENDTKNPQNKLQSLTFDVAVTGSASQTVQ